MTVQGLITEYNPFHYGHKYHLNESKKISGANFTVAIMSGSFLQRGEPAFVDKWTRAKMAVDNGIDLVLELPFLYSSQSAEYFAYGSVKLLDSLNIVDYLCFGSELGQIEPLKDIANILAVEPIIFKEKLRYHLSRGESYSVARSYATEEYINTVLLKMQYDYKEILNKSNNILGIEYLKALIRLNSNIKPITIRRSGSEYKDKSLDLGYASATGIRNQIEVENLDSVVDLVPNKTFDSLNKFHLKYNTFNHLRNYEDILIYLLRTSDKKLVKNLIDIEDGLDNRIINMGSTYNNIESIISHIVTKRYPRTRIQRLLIHLLHNLTREKFLELSSYYPSFIRVLGANKKGLKLINRIKDNSQVPLITKFADFKSFKNKKLEKSIMLDKKSTDIYFMGLKSSQSKANMDYYVSPYISE